MRVLIVDDSPVARRLVERVLLRAGVEVVAELSDGGGVVETARAERADIVILDLEMPDCSGQDVVAALLKADLEVGVLIYSGASRKALEPLMEATKRRLPCRIVLKGAGAGGGIEGLRERLVPTVQELGAEVLGRRARLASPKGSAPARPPEVDPPVRPGAVQGNALASTARPDFGLVVVGASTGGPEALRQVLVELPADLPVPVAVVQHMPVGFTDQLAKRLNSQCAIEVREAQDGEILEPGCVLIAPGGQHLELRRSGSQLRAVLTNAEPENSCRPAVDVLFRTAGQLRLDAVLAVVLTGMGQDGLVGMEHVRTAGGWAIAQDEATSVVWGMPGAVIRAGLTDEVLPLPAIGRRIIELVARDRSSRRAS